MSPHREDFAAFFADLHGGHEPFAWQERLLDQVLTGGRWPHRLVAPTGSGKTAAIDVHVFACALAAEADRRGPRPPRRLAMVVDRRVLVDDQYEYARALAARLAAPDTAVLAEVAERLWALRIPDPQRRATARLDESEIAPSPLVVGRLRGGLPPSRSWRDHPTAASVICATPDMWGSRLLFRGYGSSPRAWPREAGLLAMDSVVVVDEAHLARQVLCTARRVADLVQVVDGGPSWPALQVVETTATPAGLDDGATAVNVALEDLDNPHLRDRLIRPKPVTLLPVRDWTSTRPDKRIAVTFADAALELLAPSSVPDGPTATVGCFANTVGRALAVAAELEARRIGDRPVRVVMICGQIRPIDVDRVRAAHPGLLEPAGNPEVDVLVSTQSLEVGVDLDLAAVVTDLASGSALAQRAGRVNRRGLREVGPVVVMVPELLEGGADPQAVIADAARSGPYNADDLRAALAWVQRRAGDPDGFAPWRLRGDPPPAAGSRRPLYQRPELMDAWHWARTSDDLAADPELDLWLAEDFEANTTVGIVVRDRLPVDTDQALELVRILAPRRHETFPVPLRTARGALRAYRARCVDPDDGSEHAMTPPIVVRGEEVAVLQWAESTDDSDGLVPRLRPGDVVVLDAQADLFSPGGAGAFSPPVVLAPDDLEAGSLSVAHDALEAEAKLPAQVWKERRIGGVVLRIELNGATSHHPVLRQELTNGTAQLTEAEERAAVAGHLAALTTSGDASHMQRAAAELLDEAAPRSQVVVQRDADGAPVRVLVVDRRRAGSDESLRQVWTPRARTVTLHDHQAAVADRAALLARKLGLSAELEAALSMAGAHHDDGKRDHRFQARLGGSGEPLLAKSRAGTTLEQARRREVRSGLPARWRHEQRSLLEAWEPVRAESGVDAELITRLVGTSHGHGRHGFPHAPAELLPPNDASLLARAEELFDAGGWDELIEVTQRRYGVWGCAYLEALLRAADGQVSEEGG